MNEPTTSPEQLYFRTGPSGLMGSLKFKVTRLNVFTFRAFGIDDYNLC